MNKLTIIRIIMMIVFGALFVVLLITYLSRLSL